ncbi:MAG: uracil phosphoribosyltransferase [Brevinema sp.]
MGIFELNHPLIQHKLTILRDKESDTKIFRENLNEISKLMTYEATKSLQLKEIQVESPLGFAVGFQLIEKVAIVPILRAGLGMVDGILSLIPTAKIGHIGMYRDEENHKPMGYYCKLPQDIADSQVFVVDPMLATGESAVYAIRQLKQQGVKNITFMCIIASPEGISKLLLDYPEIDIYVAKIDSGLNDSLFIYPGLGDCGDRIFGTK